MSISTKAIDRIFEKLEAVYAAEFLARIGKTKLSDVKTAWAETLDSFGTKSGLDAIAWALSTDNLPERAPNAIEFRNLCRKAPAPAEEVPALPAKADPERLKAELSRLGGIRAAAKASALVDHKAWARRLKAREEAGERLGVAQRRFWREALAPKAPSEDEA